MKLLLKYFGEFVVVSCFFLFLIFFRAKFFFFYFYLPFFTFLPKIQISFCVVRKTSEMFCANMMYNLKRNITETFFIAALQ